MYMGVHSVWGPGGQLNWESSLKWTGNHPWNVLGAEQGPWLGWIVGSIAASSVAWMDGWMDWMGPRVKGSSSPGVTSFKKSSKKTSESPQVGCMCHTQNSKLIRQLALCWRNHELSERGAEHFGIPQHPWRVRIPPHTGLSHSRITDLIIFFPERLWPVMSKLFIKVS